MKDKFFLLFFNKDIDNPNKRRINGRTNASRLIFLKKRNVKNYYNMDGVDERQENIVLHGAFLIFSKKYFEKFNFFKNCLDKFCFL